MHLSLAIPFVLLISTDSCPASAQNPPSPSETIRSQPPAKTTPASETSSLPSSPAAQAETTVLLKEGTALKLKLLHSLNSKTVILDDPLNFSLAENLLLDGKLLLKAGAPAIGRVRQARPARTMGRGGELALELQYLKAGRTRVPLRGSQARQGQGKVGETVALTVLFGLSGLLKHGSEIELKEGSLFTAYVDQDTVVRGHAGQLMNGREQK